MSSTALIVDGLVSVVSEACHRPTEQDSTSGDDFESLVASTGETFWPRSRSVHRSGKPKFHLISYISSHLRDVSNNLTYSLSKRSTPTMLSTIIQCAEILNRTPTYALGTA